MTCYITTSSANVIYRTLFYNLLGIIVSPATPSLPMWKPTLRMHQAQRQASSSASIIISWKHLPSRDGSVAMKGPHDFGFDMQGIHSGHSWSFRHHTFGQSREIYKQFIDPSVPTMPDKARHRSRSGKGDSMHALCDNKELLDCDG